MLHRQKEVKLGDKMLAGNAAGAGIIRKADRQRSR